MDALANVEPALVCSRVMQIFFGAFLYIYLIAKLLAPKTSRPGSENVKNIPSSTAVVFSVRILTLVILSAGRA